MAGVVGYDNGLEQAVGGIAIEFDTLWETLIYGGVGFVALHHQGLQAQVEIAVVGLDGEHVVDRLHGSDGQVEHIRLGELAPAGYNEDSKRRNACYP